MASRCLIFCFYCFLNKFFRLLSESWAVFRWKTWRHVGWLWSCGMSPPPASFPKRFPAPCSMRRRNGKNFWKSSQNPAPRPDSRVSLTSTLSTRSSFTDAILKTQAGLRTSLQFSTICIQKWNCPRRQSGKRNSFPRSVSKFSSWDIANLISSIRKELSASFVRCSRQTVQT